MKRSIKLSRLGGITINMHWTFLILLAWVIAANSVQGLTWDKILWSFIFIVLVFLSVLFHELGHLWGAKRFNILTKEITLLPTGGISYYETFPKSTKQELLINLVGPAINLGIAGLLLPFIQHQVPIWEVPPHFDIIHEDDFLYKLHLVNLGLFAVNLIPAFPLDGGRIFRAIFGLRMNYFKATSIVVLIGKVLAVVFFIAAIIYFNLVLLLLSLLIFGAVQAEEFVLHLRSLIKDLKFSEVVINDYQSVQVNNTMHEAMNTLMSNHAKHFWVMEGGKPVGTIHRMEIINEVAEKNYTLPVKNLMNRNLSFFNADADVQQEFKLLVSHPYRNYPVMKNDKFVGVVNLMCILEYLMLHQLTPNEHERLKALIKKI